MSPNPNPQRSDFANVLLRERAKHHLSRTRVAEVLSRFVEGRGLVSIDGSMIRRWEAGDGIPSPEAFAAFINVLPKVCVHPPIWATSNLPDKHNFLRGMQKLVDEVERKHGNPRPRPQTFGEGLRRIAFQDEGVDAVGLAVALGGDLSVMPVDDSDLDTTAWMNSAAIPNDQQLAQLFEVLPALQAAIAVGAVMRPRIEEKNVQLIQPVPDKDARKQLGELIQRARVQRDRSHRDLANRCNVSIDEIKAWEAGEEVPRGREWAKLKGNLYSLNACALVWRAALETADSIEVNIDDEEEAVKEEVAKEEAVAPHVLPPPDPTPPPPLQDPTTQTTFGPALRIARLNAGFTQNELGELVGVHGTAITGAAGPAAAE